MASVLVPIAEGTEELEAVTIIDLLVRAQIDVTCASLDGNPITASRGVRIIPDMSLDEALKHEYDMVVLPGGLPGATHLDADPRIHQLLKKMASQNRYTAAICAAPRILANAGLLSGKTATSYPGHVDKMNLPDVNYSSEAVVIDGKIVTSRGPGTAMDFALSLIELLKGRQIRDNVEAALLRPAK